MRIETTSGATVNSYTQDISVAQVINTTTETEFHRFTISGHLLNATGSLRMMVFGAYFSTVAGASIRIRIRGTTVGGAANSGIVFYNALHSPTTGSGDRDFELMWFFTNDSNAGNPETTQGSLGQSRLSNINTTAGLTGDVIAAEDQEAHYHNSSQDTQSPWDLVVTATPSSASPNLYYTANVGYIELLQAT